MIRAAIAAIVFPFGVAACGGVESHNASKAPRQFRDQLERGHRQGPEDQLEGLVALTDLGIAIAVGTALVLLSGVMNGWRELEIMWFLSLAAVFVLCVIVLYNNVASSPPKPAPTLPPLQSVPSVLIPTTGVKP